MFESLSSRDRNQMGETDDKNSPRGERQEKKHLKAVHFLASVPRYEFQQGSLSGTGEKNVLLLLSDITFKLFHYWVGFFYSKN